MAKKPQSLKDLVTDPTQPFTLCAKVNGTLQAEYVFQNTAQYQDWEKRWLPDLKKKYGNLHVRTESLPGFKVGDICGIYGEGLDEFKILNVRGHGYVYFYVLEKGDAEPVSKSFDVQKEKAIYNDTTDSPFP